MKKLVASLALVAFLAGSANAGMFCSAAKTFKYQSDVLNSFCIQEMIFALEGGWDN